MNSLEIKKRAFMSVVTRRYGFIRTKSGAPPLTLTNCLSGNLVDYKIFGNVGKNLIPYPYAETTKTVSGITFTDNGDGSITVNGTATANAIFRLNKASTSIHVDKGEIYRLSGAPTGGGTSAYLLLAYDTVNGYSDTGNGGVFTPRSENLTVSIRAYTGTTFDNLVFKPMLTKGGDATEYEPYKAVGDLDGDKYKIPITVGNNTTNIFLNDPLGTGESIDYKTDSLPDIFVSEGTNIISAETEIKPSAIEVKYRSSIEEG